jgi:hypothetical protein
MMKGVLKEGAMERVLIGRNDGWGHGGEGRCEGGELDPRVELEGIREPDIDGLENSGMWARK